MRVTTFSPVQTMSPASRRPPASRGKLSDDELDALSLPPTGPDGALLEVDFRMTVFHVGKVDTREQTSFVRMGIVMYWIDPRMEGWSSPILPPTLWGPELWLRNAMGGVSIEYEQFVVFNVEEGRMKRILNYEATIITPMNLLTFPFDVQHLSPEWVSISHWRQLDGGRFGSLPLGQSYQLVPIRRKNEGAFLMMFFSGQINEWELHSYTTGVSSSKNPAGFTLTLVSVQFNIVRRYPYYLSKIVVPLCFLAVCSHLIHFLPCSELGDRLANTFTMFLAAFALLYVVGETVPRVDFLTTIDRIIYLSLFVLCWLGLESSVLYYLDLAGYVHAVWLDRGLGIASLVVFAVSVAFLVVPAIRRQEAAVKAIERTQKEAKEEERLAAEREGRHQRSASDIIRKLQNKKSKAKSEGSTDSDASVAKLSASRWRDLARSRAASRRTAPTSTT